jgi:hypothetical protein
VTLDNVHELFIFMAAHELRHLWQWENQPKIRKIRGLLRCTDETDADIHAIRMLSAYKS